MLLENAEGYDFRMVYYNSDGKEGSMCGNGGRAISKFAIDLGIVTKKEAEFIAVDGKHEFLYKKQFDSAKNDRCRKN